MTDVKEWKIGTIVEKKDLGLLGKPFEKNPRVIKISYEIYDNVSGVSCDIIAKCEDYDEIQENFDDETLECHCTEDGEPCRKCKLKVTIREGEE